MADKTVPGSPKVVKAVTQGQAPLEQYGVHGIFGAISRAGVGHEPRDEFGQPLPTSIGRISRIKVED